MKRSRPHHYFFAHRLLPALFHEDPAQFVSLLQRDGLPFLAFWWQKARQDFPPDEHVSADGLGYTLRELEGGWLAVVVTLPPPQGMTEAYLVALLQQRLPAAAKPNTRVFTLELGFSLTSETAHTVLCEWTPESTHLNRGTGPTPEVEAFLTAIQPLL
jgi:hypothetical protein